MTYQTSYSEDHRPGFVGMVADMSSANILSRTLVGAAIGFGKLVAPGTVDHTCRAIGAQTFTVEAAAVAGNTGNGVLTLADPAYGAGVKAGTYRVIAIEPAANLGTFSVEDPDGVQIGVASVGVAFTGVVKFTIADGATDFVAGDTFTLAVAENAADSLINDPLGVTVRNQATIETDGYAVGDTVSVMNQGPIWVTAGGTVKPSGPVYYVIATGRFAHAGDILVPNAKFMTSAVNAALVKLHLL